jgi:hypothetical protein
MDARDIRMATRHQPGSELSHRSKIDAATVNFDSALRIMVKIEGKFLILPRQQRNGVGLLARR